MTLSKKDIIKMLDGKVNIIVVSRGEVKDKQVMNGNELHRIKQRKFICKKCHKSVYRIVVGTRADLKLCSDDAPKIKLIKKNRVNTPKEVAVVMEKVSELAAKHKGKEWDELVSIATQSQDGK